MVGDISEVDSNFFLLENIIWSLIVVPYFLQVVAKAERLAAETSGN